MTVATPKIKRKAWRPKLDVGQVCEQTSDRRGTLRVRFYKRRDNMKRLLRGAVCMASAWVMTIPAAADNFLGGDEGKLLLTAGFSDVEGAGGGGLVPFAVVTGYGSTDSWGANAHFTTIRLSDLDLHAYGVAVGAFDRYELSYTRHELDITGTALDGLRVEQDIVGLKVRLYGDAVYSQDLWIPQISAGLEFKRHGGISNAQETGNAGLVSPVQLGASDADGTDFYIAATKVFLAERLVVNTTLRSTEANQFGLLGFGGDRHDGRSVEFEATGGYLLTRRLVVGAEYRGRPHNLTVDDEGAAWDVFAAWTPTKNISVVAAYLNLGSVLAPVTGQSRDQDGLYLSLQAGF